MNHDWYAAFAIETRQDVDSLVRGGGRYAEISDVTARASLLCTTLGVEDQWPDAQGRPNRIDPKTHAQAGERRKPAGLRMLHAFRPAHPSAQLLRDLDMERGSDVSILPTGSFVLRLPITFATPWLSRDDVGLYVIDNPVRKDPVFGVPTISPSGWKGMLRWAAMTVCLEPLRDRPDQFAQERVALTHLFGSEKGIDEEQPRDLAKHLNGMCPQTALQYRRLLSSAQTAAEPGEHGEALLRWRGRIRCHSTFFDRIGLEVINPHDRKTGAGEKPIYFECVPAGATGVFEILYIPWPYGEEARPLASPIDIILSDMDRLVRALRALCLDFGISAKRSSGYGRLADRWSDKEALLRFNTGRGVRAHSFGTFSALSEAVNVIRREVGHG